MTSPTANRWRITGRGSAASVGLRMPHRGFGEAFRYAPRIREALAIVMGRTLDHRPFSKVHAALGEQCFQMLHGLRATAGVGDERRE